MGRAMMPPSMTGGMGGLGGLGGMGMGADPTGMGGMGGMGMAGAGAGTGAAGEPHHCPKWARMFCGITECGHDAEW